MGWAHCAGRAVFTSHTGSTWRATGNMLLVVTDAFSGEVTRVSGKRPGCGAAGGAHRALPSFLRGTHLRLSRLRSFPEGTSPRSSFCEVLHASLQTYTWLRKTPRPSTALWADGELAPERTQAPSQFLTPGTAPEEPDSASLRPRPAAGVVSLTQAQGRWAMSCHVPGQHPDGDARPPAGRKGYAWLTTAP
uniref:Uncharacterized protein n=1 Tax=Myotis myotis TaxID=51298 RepID=A0A7J7QZV5_MYOMY|nr:hypothetical protein mMyoMyo1_011253 [Myotis myotis]